jgi:protocatechuate 3,4-dioxygenase beta subunit
MKKWHLAVVAAVIGVAVLAVWRAKAPPSPSSAPAPLAGPKLKVKARPPEGGAPPLAELRVLVDDEPAGQLRLEGQVIDAGSHGVADATVAITSNPPRTVKTEADGSFVIESLVARPYTLVARAGAGVAGPVTVRLSTQPEPVIMQLRPAAQVEVTVVRPDGAPAPDAQVELRGVDVQRLASDGRGVARFEIVVPGGYEVVAWAPGFARSFTGAQVSAGDNRLRVALVRGAAVTGVVRSADGKPVAEARVTFVGASDWNVRGDERLDGVASDAEGRYRLAAVPAGSFRLVARHPDHAPGSSELVTLDGITARPGIDIQMPAGARVSGRVVDAAGAPVALARIRIGVAGTGMFSDAPRQVFGDDRGEFSLSGLPRKKLRAFASHESGSSATVDVDASSGEVKDLRLVIDVTGTISGVVVDPQGEPLEGIQVSAGPNFRDARTRQADLSQWRLRGFPQELTDSAGRFTLTGLAPGSYQVRATRVTAPGRGRAWAGDGTEAEAGATNVRLVLAPEGSVTGKVAFADGTAPVAFTVGVGMISESFLGKSGEFTLAALPPGEYQLSVRGPSFDNRSVPVTVASAKVADVGTITVSKGRTIAGTVVADGQPVAAATVYAGRMIFGTGSSSKAQGGPMGRGTKDTVTDDNGQFSLSGFGPGDITVVAEQLERGRSRALRVMSGDPTEQNLTLVIEAFGALTGVLRQDGQPIEGTIVSCQSTTTPGAIYTVASGPDGRYRFDKLAPDTYKVSATMGMPMTGMKFYSKQVDLPPGKEISLDLTVEAGGVTLKVTGTPATGTLGVANVWLASGVLAAATSRELGLRLAGAGAGSSQWQILPRGGSATFSDVRPGAYTTCVVPLPVEIQGMAAMGYSERHGDNLPAFCQQVEVKAQPAEQSVQVPVEIPAMISDAPTGPTGPTDGAGVGPRPVSR